MTSASRQPTLWWIRRDLRLIDNPALAEALARGGPVMPVFRRTPPGPELPLRSSQ